MTWYEAKLDQLRKMGVVDMSLTFGCLIDECKDIGIPKSRWFVVNDEDEEYIWIMHNNSNKIIAVNRNWFYKNEKYVLWHPPYLNRCLWRIEKNHITQYVYKSIDLCNLRTKKDKPLSEQDNREEIMDLILNLGK